MKIFSKRQQNIYREDARDARKPENVFDIKNPVFGLSAFLATIAPWRFNGFGSGLSGLGERFRYAKQVRRHYNPEIASL